MPPAGRQKPPQDPKPLPGGLLGPARGAMDPPPRRPPRSFSVPIGGQAIATEVPQTVDERILRLRWEDMDAASVAIVQSLLAGSGPVTVLTHAAATPATCAFGQRSGQKIVPLVAPAYPETLAD